MPHLLKIRLATEKEALVIQASNPDYRGMFSERMLHILAELSFKCPHCGSAKGSQCRDRLFRLISYKRDKVHDARFVLAVLRYGEPRPANAGERLPGTAVYVLG